MSLTDLQFLVLVCARLAASEPVDRLFNRQTGVNKGEMRHYPLTSKPHLKDGACLQLRLIRAPSVKDIMVVPHHDLQGNQAVFVSESFWWASLHHQLHAYMHPSVCTSPNG